MMNTSKKKGFALLIAVMIASVLLSMTMVMFSISIKQLTLSTTGRESQYALYSADTALECAIYWDYRGHPLNGALFGVPTFVDAESGTYSGVALPDFDAEFECVNQSISIVRNSGNAQFDMTRSADGKSVVTIFNLVTTPVTGRTTIANVRITKEVESPTKIKTTIEARGHNVENLNNPFAVERGLEVNY